MTDTIETSDMTEAAEPVETAEEATAACAGTTSAILGVAVLASARRRSASRPHSRPIVTTPRRHATRRRQARRTAEDTTSRAGSARPRAHRAKATLADVEKITTSLHELTDLERAGDRHARGRAPARHQHARRRRRVQRAGRPCDRPDDADGRQVQGDPAVRRRTAQPRHGCSSQSQPRPGRPGGCVQSLTRRPGRPSTRRWSRSSPMSAPACDGRPARAAGARTRGTGVDGSETQLHPMLERLELLIQTAPRRRRSAARGQTW